jgi:hypothetical protein
MSQAELSQGVAAAAEVTAAPEAQGVESQAPVAPVAAPEGDQFVQVQAKDLAAHGYGKDFSAALHDAKVGRQFESDGWSQLDKVSKDYGVNAFDLISFLQQQQQDGAGQQQAGQAAPYDPYGQQQGQPAAQPPQDLEAMMDGRFAQFRNDMAQQQALQQGRQAENQFIDEALESIGVKGTTQKVDAFGREVEVDPVQEYVVKPAMMNAIEQEIKRSLNTNDPQYHQKVAAPASREVVQRAAAAIKPFLSGMMQQAAEALAQSQTTTPPTTLGPQGPTGRPQMNVGDMTPDQRKAEVIRRAKTNPEWKDV